MSQVTPVADAVSAPVAGSDPTPRSASLRFGVGSLNPGSNCGRRKRLGGSPLRCPREGRCGAGAPVARGSSQVLGSPAERLSSGRRVEARSAALRSVNTPAPRASQRPRAPMAAASGRIAPMPPPLDREACSHLRAGERPAHAPQRPCKRFWRTFTPSPHSRRGTALKGAQNGLERFRGIPAPPEPRHAPSCRKGRRRGPAQM